MFLTASTVPTMVLLLLPLVLGSAGASSQERRPVAFEVLGTMRHEQESFTQGLLIHDGRLFESTGLYGKSQLREVDSRTGKVLRRTSIKDRYFGEGIAVVGEVLFMLTWKEKALLMFDVNSFKLVNELIFSSAHGPGWGLTFDGQHLVCSDGSDVITFWEVPSVSSSVTKEVRRVSVKNRKGQPRDNINELEYVHGFIYANIWYRDEIVKIDPATGLIVEHLDMSRLFPVKDRPRGVDCLNGIAYNQSSGLFLLTGKLWPLYYTVALHGSKSELEL